MSIIFVVNILSLIIILILLRTSCSTWNISSVMLTINEFFDMSCLFPFYVEGVPVPCGRCPNCMTRKANEWAFRIMQHEKTAVSSHWITLTYDWDHVPLTPRNFMTLDRSHVQKFFKRVRKWHDVHMNGRGRPPVKYYGCGEYGSLYHRPHYHIAVLNADERSFWPSWTDVDDGLPMGDIYIDPRPLSDAAIVYSALYMNKPRRAGLASWDDRVKEFSMSSKNLGLSYLTPEIVKYHRSDLNRNFITLPGGGKIALPRYYADRIYTADDKEARKDFLDTTIRRQHKIAYDDYVRRHGSADGFIDEQNERRRVAVKHFQLKKHGDTD